jgi:hypothetical protein
VWEALALICGRDRAAFSKWAFDGNRYIFFRCAAHDSRPFEGAEGVPTELTLYFELPIGGT